MIDLSKEFWPCHKNVRIKDKKLLKDKKGNCKYCGKKNCYTEKHHIKSKGSGGDDTEDNLIELCFNCHKLAHDGTISKTELRRKKNEQSNSDRTLNKAKK
jgi:Restriction endonuclease